MNLEEFRKWEAKASECKKRIRKRYSTSKTDSIRKNYQSWARVLRSSLNKLRLHPACAL